MPHQCTSCGRTFADGSKEMLSGCPNCGGNKFQFRPASDGATGGSDVPGGRSDGVGGAAPKKQPETVSSDDSAGATIGGDAAGQSEARKANRGSAAPETGGDRSAVDRAAATVREWVGGGGDRTDGTSDRGAPERSPSGPEDSAQVSARSDVVSDDELPDDPPETRVQAPANGDRGATVADAPDDEAPGLQELREELNSQFESIRIVNPGQYELNLMELYEREEYIIALQQDGKYVIEVPDAWDPSDA